MEFGIGVDGLPHVIGLMRLVADIELGVTHPSVAVKKPFDLPNRKDEVR